MDEQTLVRIARDAWLLAQPITNSSEFEAQLTTQLRRAGDIPYEVCGGAYSLVQYVVGKEDEDLLLQALVWFQMHQGPTKDDAVHYEEKINDVLSQWLTEPFTLEDV